MRNVSAASRARSFVAASESGSKSASISAVAGFTVAMAIGSHKFLSGEIRFDDAQLTSNVASLLSGFVERLITVAGRSYQASRQER
jgi:hypothetical protein